jgi:hypothetical protein
MSRPSLDPSLWREQIARWTDRGWPVVEWPNTLPRMIPACRDFYAAVVEQRLRTTVPAPGPSHCQCDHQGGQPRPAHRQAGKRSEDRLGGAPQWRTTSCHATSPSRNTRARSGSWTDEHSRRPCALRARLVPRKRTRARLSSDPRIEQIGESRGNGRMRIDGIVTLVMAVAWRPCGQPETLAGQSFRPERDGPPTRAGRVAQTIARPPTTATQPRDPDGQTGLRRSGIACRPSSVAFRRH